MSSFSSLQQRLNNLPPELYELVKEYTFTINPGKIVKVDRYFHPPPNLQVNVHFRDLLLHEYYSKSIFEFYGSQKRDYFSDSSRWGIWRYEALIKEVHLLTNVAPCAHKGRVGHYRYLFENNGMRSGDFSIDCSDSGHLIVWKYRADDDEGASGRLVHVGGSCRCGKRGRRRRKANSNAFPDQRS